MSDANRMQCLVEVLETEKQSGEFICLAVINADGTIQDKRTYARGKVPGFYASTEGMQVNITETYTGPLSFGGQNIEVPIGDGNFKHLCITAECSYFDNKLRGVFYCDFDNGRAVNLGVLAVEGGTENYIYYNRNLGACRIGPDVKLQDGKLIIPVLQGNVNKGYAVVFSYHLW